MFANNFDCLVGNTFFKKDAEKLTTYKFGYCVTVVDCIMVQKVVMKNVRDAKVIPGEECFSQHRLLTINLMLEDRLLTIAAWETKNSGRVKL